MSKHLPQSHQGEWPELTKFDKLRIKTEMQLVQLINTELDLGIRDARQALKSVDTFAAVEECNRRASRVYTKVARLIPLVVEITEDERRTATSKLEKLQRMLEALSAIGSTPAPAEEEIAALARAVWEARGCLEGLPEEDWFRAERALKAQRESKAVCA
jgi:HAMP domain-containing protein